MAETHRRETALPLAARLRLVAFGLFLGTSGLVGITVFDPELVPLKEQLGGCLLVAGLAGVIAVLAAHRFWPDRFPAWMLGVAGAGAQSGRERSTR